MLDYKSLNEEFKQTQRLPMLVVYKGGFDYTKNLSAHTGPCFHFIPDKAEMESVVLYSTYSGIIVEEDADFSKEKIWSFISRVPKSKQALLIMDKTHINRLEEVFKEYVDGVLVDGSNLQRQVKEWGDCLLSCCVPHKVFSKDTLLPYSIQPVKSEE